MLHQPERDLAEAGEQPVSQRVAETERFAGAGHAFSAHGRLWIERGAVLIRRRIGAASAREADCGGKVVIRGHDVVGKYASAGVLPVGVEDDLQRGADGVASAKMADRRFERWLEGIGAAGGDRDM